MGFKAPRGYGWVTNPKRAAYNRWPLCSNLSGRLFGAKGAEKNVVENASYQLKAQSKKQNGPNNV